MALTWNQQRARRDLLVEQSLQLFVNRPLNEASVKWIAEELGVPFRTVYSHFTHEELFRAAVLKIAENLKEEIASAPLDGSTIYEALSCCIRHLAQIISGPSYRNVLYLLVRDKCRCPWLEDLFQQHVAEPMNTLISDVVTAVGERLGAVIMLSPGTSQQIVSRLEAALIQPRLLPDALETSKEELDRLVFQLTKDAVESSYALETL